MVLEVAHIPVLSGHEEAFERALNQAATTVLVRADGFLNFTAYGWCVERPSVFLFTIEWNTLDDHVVGFRGSDLFGEWRALIGEHFDGAPVVEHFAVR